MNYLKSAPLFLSPTGPVSNRENYIYYVVFMTTLGYLKVAFMSVMRPSATPNKIPPYHGLFTKENDKRI